MEGGCLDCGKAFPIPRGLEKRKKSCSPTCQKLYWRKRNREKDLFQRRAYNKKRKFDPIKHQCDVECRKRWRLANKSKKYSYKRAYRARKYGNGGRHTQWDWEALKYAYGYTCQICGGKEPVTPLTEDHTIPLTRGGTDEIENIQPLCKSCNSIKNDREWFSAV